MTEELRRSGGRAFVALPMTNSDDRLSSSGSIPVGLSGKKIVIKSADMKEDMQKEAVDVAIAAFEKHNVEKDVAESIKKVFDKKHGPTWHCIGKNFGREKVEARQDRSVHYASTSKDKGNKRKDNEATSEETTKES
ncbi:uncharacterized protein [Primulina huaijiensis]|uniref:uncharacterized protein isoform X1 n=1 Tax=Primulina huaijiensis TaxID=1492673 RepID=UPI003CC71094